jgi:hypothetical protein
MMRWEWVVDGRLETAVWGDGLFVSSSFGLEILADALVASQVIVECGLLGPSLEAGLGDEVVAWGTISEALSQYCEAVGPVEFNDWAVCPVIPEEENENDNSFMSKVADALAKASFGGDRSAAGRYAANQRWQGQGKTELKIPVPTPKASDISKELKAYFGGTEKQYVKSQGYEEIQKRTIEKRTKGGTSIGDLRLEVIADKQGFSGLPKVVSSDEMDQLEKQGWTIAYRGIQDGTIVGYKELRAQDLAKQFLEGDYYGGFGTFANGTYCAEDARVAETYADTPSKGVVMKIAIPPKTIMSRDEFLRFVDKSYDESKKDPLFRKHLFYGDDDLGRLLMAKGYRGAETTSGVFVLWDRSMLAVQELDTSK